MNRQERQERKRNRREQQEDRHVPPAPAAPAALPAPPAPQPLPLPITTLLALQGIGAVPTPQIVADAVDAIGAEQRLGVLRRVNRDLPGPTKAAVVACLSPGARGPDIARCVADPATAIGIAEAIKLVFGADDDVGAPLSQLRGVAAPFVASVRAARLAPNLALFAAETPVPALNQILEDLRWYARSRLPPSVLALALGTAAPNNIAEEFAARAAIVSLLSPGLTNALAPYTGGVKVTLGQAADILWGDDAAAAVWAKLEQ